MRAIVEYIRTFFRRVLRKDDRGLTEVEYEAITLIAQEGRGALTKAREQAAYCRRRGSEQGYEFWLRVANEISMRATGKPAQPARGGETARKGS